MGPERSPLSRVVVVVDIDVRVRQWRHLVNGRAAAHSGEWAQRFQMLLVADCSQKLIPYWVCRCLHHPESVKHGRLDMKPTVTLSPQQQSTAIIPTIARH